MLSVSRLSTRLAIGLIVMLVASALAMWYLEHSRLRDAYIGERISHLDKSIQSQRLRLNQQVDMLRRDVLFLSNTPPISGILRATQNSGIDPRDGNTRAKWEERLREIFSAFSRTHPDSYRIRYIGAADGGRELVRVDSQKGEIVSSMPDRELVYAEREFFKRTLKLPRGEVYLSEFEYQQEPLGSEIGRIQTLRAATPVYDASGKIFGLVAISLDVSSLLESAREGLPADVQTYVANRAGQYLLHPDAVRSFAFGSSERDRITADFPILAQMFQPRADGLSPMQATVLSDDEQLFAATRLHVDPGNPARFMVLMYRIPDVLAGIPVFALPAAHVAAGLAGLLLIGAVAMRLLRRTFAPLEQLTSAADRISAGEHLILLPKSDAGEIGRLLGAFGSMQERLAQREREIWDINAGLEQQVAERTTQLEQANERLREEIRQREHVVEIIRREHDFRQEMIESLPGIFYMIDASGRFLMWNDNLERVLHCSAEELVRGSPLDFFEGNDRVSIEVAILKVFEQGEAAVDALLTANDGTRTPYHFTGRRIMRDGEPVLVGLGIDIAERQRILRETETLLRRNQALMATSMDGVHVMDIQGNIVEANEAFCRMLGYSLEEVLGMNVADWDVKWSGDELHERFLALIGKSALFETVHRRKDGALIDVEISSSGVEIDGLGFLFASSRDITERKMAEQALTDSERKFHALYDSMTEGVALHELLLDDSGKPSDYVLLDVNAAYEIITGMRRQDVVGRRASDLYGIGVPPYLEVYAGVALTGNAARFDTRFEPMGLDFSISVFSPAMNQFATVFEDITERKTAEEALRRYKQVIETVADGFWLTDMQGNLLEANQAYADMSGYTVEELTRMHISQLEAREQPEETRAHIEKIMRQGHDRFETRHRHRDGHEIDIEISVTYMSEKQWLFVFCHDISRRKQDEQARQIAAVAFETQDAIMITDADANIVRVNRSFERVTGYSAADVLGKNPRIMNSGRHDKQFYREMWQTLKDEGAWTGEIWDKRKNGQIYPRQVTITAVRNDRNEITHYVGVFADITERKRAEEEIRNLAFYDALAATSRHRNYGALLFLDMDKFKSLNDTLGHDYGDLMLIEVADRLKSCVREVDTVARLGGDEFVVLIEGAGGGEQVALRKVAKVAEKIRETLARPYCLKEHEHLSSPSIGVTLFHGNGESVEDLLRQADMAMYQVKKSGRNAVRFFEPEMQLSMESDGALEDDLSHAIERGELHLYYQVQVDGERRPIGAEALLRWEQPQRGLLMPDDFLPLAESGKLIVEIDRWVLNEACARLARWSGDERTRALRLAVNISARFFAQPDFIEYVAAMLKAHSIRPELLVLEPTEHMVLVDLPGAIAKMLELKALGVSLSMDDFGSGFSSLTYLKQLPLDQIKICRQFVQGISVNDNDALLVQAIIDLANNFGLSVLAEGVETETQLDFIRQYRCMAFQGFLFGKPVTIAEFEAMLAELS